MKFTVLPRVAAERSNNSNVPHIIISIYTPGDVPARPITNSYTQEVLSLCFDDLPTYIPDWKGRELVYFNRELSIQILDFVDKYRDLVKEVIIHCDAGISRSAGVAVALCRYLGESDSKYFGNRSRFFPNCLVYTTIAQVVRERAFANP